MKKITALEVDQLVKTPGRYCVGDNLWLFVGKSGRQASWILRYSFQGVQQDMGLGSYHRGIKLGEARKRVQRALAIRDQGRDPRAERDAETLRLRNEVARRVTFQRCAENYLALRAPKWRNGKYAAQVPSLFKRYVFPVIGSCPVQGVTTEDVLKIVAPLWTAKHPTATKVLGQIEAVLAWATSMNHRTGENPARFKGHLEFHLPSIAKSEQKHHAALAYKAVPAFMQDLKGQAGIAAQALRWTILTAARTGETLGMRWSEIDREEALWLIPASRMKANREHRVPLSSAALDVLRETEATRSRSPFVFEGQSRDGALSSMALLALLRRMARHDITTHGFRSSFRDWCGEQAKAAWEIAEMALAHTVGSATERAYARSDLFDRRRELMEQWGSFATGNNVIVPFRASASG